MKLNQIAFQLYTCRDLIKTPAELAKTLRRLRAIGYTGVEVCCTGALTEAEINQILDDEGLVCCSTHESSPEILAHPAKIIERLQKLHCTNTAYPFPAGIDFSSPESVRTLISQLQASGTLMRQAGITLCYHNHSHEFRKLNGKTILEQIYAGTTRDALQAELDTYWVHNGGGDVVEWCEKLAGRLPVIHLKDYCTNDQNAPQLCEIGAGNLNFQKIVAAAETAGCKWFIVEQDTCPGDPVDSLEQSFRYIQANLADQ